MEAVMAVILLHNILLVLVAMVVQVVVLAMVDIIILQEVDTQEVLRLLTHLHH